MESFGVKFGRLVRAKRGIEGLSQDDLAEKAELTKARISYIETGKTGNPQIKTIDALCVALNISAEERAACYAPAPLLPQPLLEKLARQFGRDHSDALENELEAFLIEKAKEFGWCHLHLRERGSPMKNRKREIAAEGQNFRSCHRSKCCTWRR
jgi:transcriptional regulator with XRE-family HTH domain